MSFPRTKRIADLGLAAWLKMHGYRITEVAPSHVFFEITDANKAREERNLEIAYVNSDATAFDSWLMTLKRTPITRVDEMHPSIHVVQGMGLAAWVRLKGEWRLVGRPSHTDFAFYVPEHQVSEFKNLMVSWTNSQLRDFDAAMMDIKKIRIQDKPGRSQRQYTSKG